MTITQTTAAAPAAHKQGQKEIADLSAREIARRIAARELSAADTLEHFIGRLETGISERLENVAGPRQFDRDIGQNPRRALAQHDDAVGDVDVDDLLCSDP